MKVRTTDKTSQLLVGSLGIVGFGARRSYFGLEPNKLNPATFNRPGFGGAGAAI